MQLATVTKKMSWKECAHPFCSNRFYGSQFQRYCGDPRCNEMRQNERKEHRCIKDPDVDNRILSKQLVTRVITKNNVVWLRCKAKDKFGRVCGRRFQVVLESKRRVYPKFCEKHTNAYRRKLFNRSGNAKIERR